MRPFPNRMGCVSCGCSECQGMPNSPYSQTPPSAHPHRTPESSEAFQSRDKPVDVEPQHQSRCAATLCSPLINIGATHGAISHLISTPTRPCTNSSVTTTIPKSVRPSASYCTDPSNNPAAVDATPPAHEGICRPLLRDPDYRILSCMHVQCCDIPAFRYDCSSCHRGSH